jgi:uncharacterized tellurite resistance protein B-like protein
MFHQLVDFLKGPTSAVDPGRDLRMAVAILLLEAAHMDDTFSAPEYVMIQKLLATKFGLSPSEANDLLAISEEKIKNVVQLHPYTNTVFSQMSEAERIQLIEMLWEVAYADDVLDPEEDALIRKLAGLIHVPDRERMLARQRVRAKKGQS